MGRSQETFNKKEVRNKKEKKRKDKVQKRLARKDIKPKSLDDMIAYVDENGMLTSTPPDPTKKHVIEADQIEIGVPSKAANDNDDDGFSGVITFFNDSKGYGFIADSKSKRSIFFHINNTQDDVKEGNKVAFDTEMGPKGMTAINVKLVK